MIQIQPYTQRRELGSGVGTPGVTPSVADTGLGRAIENAATKAEAAFEKIADKNANSAATYAVSETNVAIETAFQEAKVNAKPGAPEFTPEFLKAYDDAVDQRAELLPDDRSKKVYRDRMIAQRDNFAARSLQWEATERSRNRVSNFSKSAEADANQLYLADPASRSELYKGQEALFNQALDDAELEPAAKQALKDEAENRRSYAAVKGDIRDRPDEVQDWLTDNGRGEAGYYARLRSVESGGRNIGSTTSSAFGPYQFTKGTWTDLIAKHPELGLTEADRFKPMAQEKAVRAFTEDNIALLKKAKIPLTPGSIYMAHFLGAFDAVSFLRANPNDDAREHVSAQAAASNPSIFKEGRTVKGVVDLFEKKFAGMERGTGGSVPSYYSALSPEKRDQLYSQAETEMRKRRIEAEGAFKQRVENSIAEYAQDGVSLMSPTEQEFVAAMGVERGTLAYGEYAAKAAGAKAVYDMTYMPPEQHAEFVQSFRPTPGDEFFAEKAAAYVQIQNAAAKLADERRNDPAATVLRRFPNAEAELRDALNPDTDDAPEKLDAWVELAKANGSPRILPNSIRDAMKKTMGRVPVDGAEASAMWLDFSRQKELWRQNWPAVLREIGDQSSDIRVIGSGVSEEVATMLLANRDKTLSDLTKPLPEGTGLLITSELQGVFGEYAASVSRLPGEDGSAFFAAGQKLTAIKMVRDGVGEEAAAEWAYEELIGKRYAFEDTTRIPRQHEDVIDSLEEAKRQALNTADLSSLPSGVSLEDARSWLNTNVRWVTLPDDSGVILMEGARALRDENGKAIAREWQDIRTVAPVSVSDAPPISTQVP